MKNRQSVKGQKLYLVEQKMASSVEDKSQNIEEKSIKKKG